MKTTRTAYAVTYWIGCDQRTARFTDYGDAMRFAQDIGEGGTVEVHTNHSIVGQFADHKLTPEFADRAGQF